MASGNSDTAIESVASGEGEADRVAGKRRPRLASRRRVLGRAAKIAAAGIGATALAAQESGRHVLAASGVRPYDNYGVFSSSVSSSPAVSASGSNGANAVAASTDSGVAVYGLSSFQAGVYGISSSGTGVLGDSSTGTGVYATSGSATGLWAQSNTGAGIFAMSSGSDAVVARAMGTTGAAVHSCAPGTPAPSSSVTAAVFAEGGSHPGVYATSDTTNAVQGSSGSGTGVLGVSGTGTGLIGESNSGSGITGVSKSDTGVVGESTSGYGVDAFSAGGTALHAKSAASNGVALFAEGLLRIAGAAVGQATIPQNLTSVTVSTAAVTANSHILLTPLSNPRGALWISNIVPGTSFQINVGVDVFFPAGLVVQYLIIN
jgi:hypothetical protein